MRFDRLDRIVQQGTVFYFFVITMGAFIVAVQNIAFLKSLKNNTNWSKCNESDFCNQQRMTNFIFVVYLNCYHVFHIRTCCSITVYFC